MPDPGSKVSIETSNEVVEGVLMPSEGNSTVIKLDNGYNIGISKKNIKKISVLKKPQKVAESKGKQVPFSKNKKRITILHTGGTVASKVDYSTGAVVSRFTPEELIALFPELKEIANIDSKLIAQMWSEDARFIHYQDMCKAIESEIKKGVDGIILTSGTDTMAYTSAALAFMCDVQIPILVVGAQRSSDRGSSDAGVNLICAAEFIAKTDFVGVAICMHDSMDDNDCVILPATKTRKLHTSRRDAFRAVNDTPIAKVDFESRKVEFFKDYTKKSNNSSVFKTKMEDKVGLIKLHTNMHKEQFEVFKGYKGLVIEGTGLGQAPINIKEHVPIFNVIRDLIKNGTVVVMTSQCIYGRVHAHVYSPAVKLNEAGVIYGEDMLPETAFIKLAWLLGNYKKDEVRSMVT
ncbi:Glu-tRNA(Gln) amidotransferase subunit GatD, partial [Nanoarchaeota archaeon]